MGQEKAYVEGATDEVDADDRYAGAPVKGDKPEEGGEGSGPDNTSLAICCPADLESPHAQELYYRIPWRGTGVLAWIQTGLPTGRPHPL